MQPAAESGGVRDQALTLPRPGGTRAARGLPGPPFGANLLREALDVASTAALEAGEAIRRFYRDSYTIKEKGGDNPLTDADLARNEILLGRLTSHFPEFGWLSEESVDDAERLEREAVWIVDPLDGTKEFTLGIPEFVVSVGLVVKGRAVLGVLYNPITEELFAGAEGLGVTFNRVATRVSTHATLDGEVP